MTNEPISHLPLHIFRFTNDFKALLLAILQISIDLHEPK